MIRSWHDTEPQMDLLHVPLCPSLTVIIAGGERVKLGVLVRDIVRFNHNCSEMGQKLQVYLGDENRKQAKILKPLSWNQNVSSWCLVIESIIQPCNQILYEHFLFFGNLGWSQDLSFWAQKAWKFSSLLSEELETLMWFKSSCMGLL